jgi:hypothetical protein
MRVSALIIIGCFTTSLGFAQGTLVLPRSPIAHPAPVRIKPEPTIRFSPEEMNGRQINGWPVLVLALGLVIESNYSAGFDEFKPQLLNRLRTYRSGSDEDLERRLMEWKDFCRSSDLLPVIYPRIDYAFHKGSLCDWIERPAITPSEVLKIIRGLESGTYDPYVSKMYTDRLVYDFFHYRPKRGDGTLRPGPLVVPDHTAVNLKVGFAGPKDDYEDEVDALHRWLRNQDLGSHGFGIAEPWMDVQSSAESLSKSLPKAADTPLPAELVEMLRKKLRSDPRLWNRVRVRRGGEDLWFRIGVKSPEEVGVGEYEATQFVLKCIQVMFPKAQVTFGARDVKPDGRRAEIDIEVFDKWESQRNGERKHPPWTVDMVKIKPANGTTSGFSHEELRKLAGIEPGTKVLALYSGEAFGRLFVGKNPINAFMERLARNTKAEIFIESENGARYGNDKRRSRYETPELLVVPLTTVHVGKIGDLLREAKRLGKKLLIFNDTIGNMPALDSISDLLIVKGPFNAFEGLNVGTPTIIRHVDPDLWNDDVMKRNREIAEKTGGGIGVGRMDEKDLYKLIDEWLVHPRVSPEMRPYQLSPDGTEPSPFDRFWEELVSALEHVL